MAHAEVEERQLLKAMTWWDGFVVALANPGFLIAALGSSIGALGTTGAFVLWTISITFGALQNNIHAELATMFPNKSGGIALYAHEAWRKYLSSSDRSPPSATGSAGRSSSRSTASSRAR